MFRIFQHEFVYRTYRMTGDPKSALDTLIRRLTVRGMVRMDNVTDALVASFRYPSIFFSSRRPLTCVSRLTAEVRHDGRETVVRIGAAFTKVRAYTIIILGFIWIGLPILVAVLRGAFPDFSPFGVLVVPLGFLLHYSVRGRVFRTLRRIIESGGE